MSSRPDPVDDACLFNALSPSSRQLKDKHLCWGRVCVYVRARACMRGYVFESRGEGQDSFATANAVTTWHVLTWRISSTHILQR